MQRYRKFLRPSKKRTSSPSVSAVIAKRHLVKEEWSDSDGYWIALIDGWMNAFDPWCHCIHEDTKAEAYSVLRAVIRCDCPEHRSNDPLDCGAIE